MYNKHSYEIYPQDSIENPNLDKVYTWLAIFGFQIKLRIVFEKEMPESTIFQSTAFDTEHSYVAVYSPANNELYKFYPLSQQTISWFFTWLFNRFSKKTPE